MGWRDFGRALRDSNLPLAAIANRDRWQQANGPVIGVRDEMGDATPMHPILSKLFPPETSTDGEDSVDEDVTQSTSRSAAWTSTPVTRPKSGRKTVPSKRYSPMGGRWVPFNQKV